jgi:hypothetical protein
LSYDESLSWVANNISNLSVAIGNNNSRVADEECDYRVADVICNSYVTDIICDSIKYAKFLNIFFVCAILSKKKFTMLYKSKK